MFGFMQTVFPIFFIIMFLLVISVFVTVFVKMIKQNRYNNAQPKLTVEAKVVSRRSDHSMRRSSTTSSMHSTTWHYVTFEVESGDRMEFSVTGQEYGLLAEGDTGKLTFQGTRYLGFDRFR
ncbi:MAG: DUF2500 domain-containing protein [Erysipelotrichaceae bacterium]|nr:DUF2500 domain-containing protein [Erysipelotrichaceae bacterium]